MYPQYLKNPEKWWQKKTDAVSRLLVVFTDLFGDEWGEDSFWQGISFLQEEMSKFDLSVVKKDIYSAFFVTQVSLLDEKDITKLINLLEKTQQAVSSETKSKKNINKDILPWHSILQSYDISQVGVDFFVSNFDIINEGEFQNIVQEWRNFLVVFQKMHSEFLLIGSALLYYSETELYSVDKIREELIAGVVSDWPSAFRFLGQAFFGRDGDTKLWATKFLLEGDFGASIKQDFVTYNFVIILLHISLSDFVNMDYEYRKIILQKYAWSSISFGLPIEPVIKTYLSKQSDLEYYIAVSGRFAEQISHCEEVVFYNDNPPITIFQFIQKFISSSRGNELDGFYQVSFVEQIIKDNVWPSDLVNYLTKILRLYLHLREGDFIDYRGILSEEKVIPKEFDWKKIIQQNLDNNTLVRVKEYLEILDRPFTARAEMITAFMDVSWQTEPFLSRILALSEIYEEVYGPVYEALIYFSEEDGQWRLNRNRPSKIVR